MGRKRPSLVRQVQEKFDALLCIGESKHEAKKQGNIRHGEALPGIYSWTTYKTYLKHACYFVKWCKKNYGCKTLQECRQYAAEWIQTRSNLSAYTQKLEASALCKLYGCCLDDLHIQTKRASRADITRSRGEASRDKHFSEDKNAALVAFCRATGLRRSELANLRGTQLINQNGNYYITVTGKGGRTRNALVINPAAVVPLMTEAGKEKVFTYIHSAADIHSYRADYATTIYKMYARDVSSLPQNELYCCRKDKKGIIYDRAAMLKASQNLGHNRVSVVGEHYLKI